MRQISCKLVGEFDQILSCGGCGLQFLRHISGLLTDSMNVVSIQGKAADLDGARREGHEAKYSPQQRRLATAALTSDTNKLTTVHLQIKATKKSLVTKGERSVREG